jgi:propanol-preferring alcohol dehydrogenase
MKACLLASPAPIESHPLQFTDMPDPEPGRGEVRVRVNACGVCRTDLHVVEGELPRRLLPVIPGHQVVGVVDRCGEGVADLEPGARVGIAWLHHTDGTCQYCRGGHENLCERPDFTGYTVNGGYAEYAIAHADFVYRLPAEFGDLAAAPLLCAGIIGFRCLRLADLSAGARLGLYGFGAAAHVAIQIARHWGVEVLACTREPKHRRLALELGAVWAGGAAEPPPHPLDAAIMFAPAGELVPPALKALKRGGSLILGGIHMSPIPQLSYDLLYWERIVRSVANNTRQDGRDFLRLAAEIPVHTETQVFPLAEANRALETLKHDGIEGAAVLKI